MNPSGSASTWSAWLGTVLSLTSIALVVLADLGWFHPIAALLVLGALAQVAATIWQPRFARPRLRPAAGLAVAILLLGAGLVAPGSENVVGPRDPGVYVASGLMIARGGNSLIHDPWLQALGEAIDGQNTDPWVYRHFVSDAPLRFPGQLFVRDLAGGLVESGFLPVVPAWIALAWSLGELEPALHVSGMFGVLALLFAMLTMRAATEGQPRLRGGWLVAGLLLAVSFPQVWWAREPMSESALGAFAWLSAWAGVRWLQVGGVRWAALAALATTAGLLARADAVLLAASIGLLFVLHRAVGWTVGLGLLVAGGILFAAHGVLLAPIYLSLTYGGFTLGRAAGGAAALATLVVVLLVKARWGSHFSEIPRLAVGWVAIRRAGVILVTAAVLGATLLGVAPGVGRDAAQGAPSPLAWLPGYVPWPVLILAGLGTIWQGWCGVPRAMAPILLVGGLPALLYLPDPLVTGDHPWMVRRLVPCVIPLLAMLAAIGAAALFHRVDGSATAAEGTVGSPGNASARNLRWLAARTAACLLVSASLGISVNQLRSEVLAPRHGEGIEEGLAALARELPSEAVVLFPRSAPGSYLVMPLQAVHGIASFTIPSSRLTPEVAAVLARWDRAGAPVYWVAPAEQTITPPPGVRMTPAGAVSLRWRSADGGQSPPPLRLNLIDLRVTLYRLAFEAD